MDDLLDRFHQRRDACVENDRRNDHCAQIFRPPVAERVLLVRAPSGNLCPDDGDDGGERVGQVVDRIQRHGNRMGQQADDGLEARQKQVRDDADQAGPNNELIAIFHKSIYLD